MTDLAWIDTMVAPNGFEGWLSATPNARILSTLAALDRIGAADVKTLVLSALATLKIDATAMSDDQREQLLDTMPDDARASLDRLDRAFYEAVDGYMDRCFAFAEAHRDRIHP